GGGRTHRCAPTGEVLRGRATTRVAPTRTGPVFSVGAAPCGRPPGRRVDVGIGLCGGLYGRSAPSVALCATAPPEGEPGARRSGAHHGRQVRGKTLPAAWREAARSGRKRGEAGSRLLTTTPSLPALA